MGRVKDWLSVTIKEITCLLPPLLFGGASISEKLGQTDVLANFSAFSSDGIPKILRGSQHLYLNEELRQKVFCITGK